jgi:DNA polymerase III delta subunit
VSKKDILDDEAPKDNTIDSRIEKILDNIPEANFVLFISPEPDTRKSFYKKLLEIATVKEFKNLSEQ